MHIFCDYLEQIEELQAEVFRIREEIQTVNRYNTIGSEISELKDLQLAVNTKSPRHNTNDIKSPSTPNLEITVIETFSTNDLISEPKPCIIYDDFLLDFPE